MVVYTEKYGKFGGWEKRSNKEYEWGIWEVKIILIDLQ